nr:MAG TPA: hypothetical protein [Caudoviricetes sp.]
MEENNEIFIFSLSKGNRLIWCPSSDFDSYRRISPFYYLLSYF